MNKKIIIIFSVMILIGGYSLHLISPNDFWPNLGAEIIGIAITVFFINEWIRYRDKTREKKESKLIEDEMKRILSVSLNELLGYVFAVLYIKCPYRTDAMERKTNHEQNYISLISEINGYNRISKKREVWYEERIREFLNIENFKKYIKSVIYNTNIGVVNYKTAYKELEPIHRSLMSIEPLYLKLLKKEQTMILIKLRHSIFKILDDMKKVEELKEISFEMKESKKWYMWSTFLPNIFFSFIFDTIKELNSLMKKGFFEINPYSYQVPENYFSDIFTEKWFKKKTNDYRKKNKNN